MELGSITETYPEKCQPNAPLRNGAENAFLPYSQNSQDTPEIAQQ